MLKGYPSQKKNLASITPFTDKQTSLVSEFATLQNTGSDRISLDVVSRGLFRALAIDAAEANSTTRVLKATSHGASANDVIRFETGANAYLEVMVLSVPDANTIILATTLPATIGVGDTFYVMKYVTPRMSSTGEMQVGGTISVTPSYLDYVQSVRNDYASVNVTTGAWVQLIASTSADVKKITCFDSGGYAMELGIGAAAAEVRKLLIPPGGLNGMIDLVIPAGSRISIRAVGTATVNAGELDLNLMG